jgi:hypothetical protein
MSASFWNLLKGEKILFYQEDSIMFKNNIMEFIHYDFISNPFPKNTNDTNHFGNDGLSLRSKSKILEVINTISAKNSNVNVNFTSESCYFYKNMKTLTIGTIADSKTSNLFSSGIIFNENSLGGNKCWTSNKEWKEFISKKFNFSLYTFNSNISAKVVVCWPLS